jgi:hypothetical protein
VSEPETDVTELQPIPGQGGVQPLPQVFEHADVKWAPADSDPGEGTPIGYALALEKHES